MSTGAWRESARQWSDTATVHCDVCGRLVPRRQWVFADGERDVAACSPACEALYFDYVRPTHGPRGIIRAGVPARG